MKKTLILFLTFFIVMTSCISDSEDIKKPDIKIDANNELPIEASVIPEPDNSIVISYIPIAEIYKDTDEAYLEEWLAYIKENYYIELQIPAQIRFYDDYNGKAQEEFLKNNLVNGLIGFAPTADTKLYELAANNKILPLTEFLKDNEVWNSLPAEMREMYLYNGEIWAIPSGYTYSCYFRQVRKEYLEKFGMEAPGTFEELSELFRRLTKDDPDGDGIDNTTGAYVSSYYVIDIFNNMNCFLQRVDNRIQVTSIAYDKNTGTFRDCMFSDDIKQPLQYIKSMLDEGIVELNRPVGIKAQTYAYYTSNGINENLNAVMWGFEGNNNNPIAINYDVPFIAVAAKTEEPSIVINKFVDVFYGNHEAYLSTQFGIPGQSFEIGSEIIIKSNDIQGNNIPYIVGYNPVLEEGMEYKSGIPDLTEYWLKRKGYETGERFKALDSAFIMEQEIVFGIKERHEYFNYTTNSAGDIYRGDELLGLFSYYYDKIMNGFITIDEGIEAYRNRAKELDVDEYISMLNDNFGLN